MVFTATFVLVPLVQARAPDWNYSSPDSVIGGISLSSKGTLIAAAAEKVLFFTSNGTLLGKEPFGSTLVMTPDGKYSASEYFSTLYFFKNPLPAGTADQQKATKMWEYALPQKVRTLSLSNDGSTLVAQTLGYDVFILNTGTTVAKGNNDEVDSLVNIAADGTRIIGISQTALHSYSKNGEITRTSALTTFSQPHTLLLSSGGSSAVFNDGQAVRCVNTNDGKERWIGRVAGYVTIVSMTPAASTVIAGTETGNITAFNAKGNLSWTYAANPENRQASGITSSAVSDNGVIIAAGTADGRILFLNAKGQLTDSFMGKEYIRHIAVSADGSTIVAASDHTLYTFTSGSSTRPMSVTTVSPSLPTPAVQSAPTAVRTQAPVFPPAPEGTSPQTISEIPTTYSVIKTSTRSPVTTLIPLLGILGAAFVLLKRQ
jgi:WD40 repeat protein